MHNHFLMPSLNRNELSHMIIPIEHCCGGSHLSADTHLPSCLLPSLYPLNPFTKVSLHNVDSGYGCPELRQLFSLCAALDAWLNLSVRNVAVLHERDGHQRCALVLAAYMLFSRQCDNATEALELYRRRRPGFTTQTPTYRRFLFHFDHLLQFGGELPNHAPLHLHKIVVHRDNIGVNGGSAGGRQGSGEQRYTLEVYHKEELLFSSAYSPAGASA